MHKAVQKLGPWSVTEEDDERLRRYIRDHFDSGGRAEALKGYINTPPAPDVLDHYSVVGRSRLPDPKAEDNWMKCFRADKHGGKGHKSGWVLRFADGHVRLLGRHCGEKHFQISRRLHLTRIKAFKDIDSAERAKELCQQQIAYLAQSLTEISAEVRKARGSAEIGIYERILTEFERKFPVEVNLIKNAFEKHGGEMKIERRVDAKTKELMGKKGSDFDQNIVGLVLGWGRLGGHGPLTKLDWAIEGLKEVGQDLGAGSLSDDDETSIVAFAKKTAQHAMDAFDSVTALTHFFGNENMRRLAHWFNNRPETAGRAQYRAVPLGIKRVESDGEEITAALPPWFSLPTLEKTADFLAVLSGKKNPPPVQAREDAA